MKTRCLIWTLDFKRDANLKSYVKNDIDGVFAKVRIGSHNGYYRAVVELDGQYRYSKKKTSNGYVYTLR